MSQNRKYDTCVCCGHGNLSREREKRRMPIAGGSVLSVIEYSACSLCGSEQADADQARANKLAFMAAKKKSNNTA